MTKRLLVFVLAARCLGSEVTTPQHTPAPLVGFSYSPLIAWQANRDPHEDLRRLLDATSADLVRLPIYWELVQPMPDAPLDFTSVDSLIDVVKTYNAETGRHAQVVLTIGARNFLYPELHQPAWVGDRAQPVIGAAQAGLAYRKYFETSISRYRSSPLLYAWQVENEGFDTVINDYTGDDAISDEQMKWEVDTVHGLDPLHQVVVTTYNALNPTFDLLNHFAPPLAWLTGVGSGHPNEALASGDAFGLDLYIDGPYIPWRDFTSVELRTHWKQQTLALWSDAAHSEGKQFWIAEAQAQPWSDEVSFTPQDLVNSAIDYREQRVDVVLLWGVETWLEDDRWLAAGMKASEILRAP
jgi:hypothetical protein